MFMSIKKQFDITYWATEIGRKELF